MFISHLTAAHWPYYTAETPFGVSNPTPGNEQPLYRIGLQTADRMFGELVEILRRKGALRNALVVVLSDHGEAFGLPGDSFFDREFRVEGLRAPLGMLDHGHGQSVLSKSQYQVLLGFKAYGDATQFGAAGRDFSFPSTVEDIAPTILEILNLNGDRLSATGRSLFPLLAGKQSYVVDMPARVRFTETDLAVLPGPGGGVDEVATARHNSIYYEVDSRSGRLQIRPRYASLVTTFKERAAFIPGHLLAALPAGPYAHQYIYLNFAEHQGRLLMARPGESEPVAQRLWDAMFDHYAGEMKTPTSTTPEDWARHDIEWENLVEAGGVQTSVEVATTHDAG